jgi:indole-3-glycerol phosphate synthase
MVDFLDAIVNNVVNTIESGYYNVDPVDHRNISLKKAIVSCHQNPVIAEFKPASPSRGFLRKKEDALLAALSAERAGAVGLSILTEPFYFKGSLNVFKKVREAVDLPLLMKDFIISSIQVEAASRAGADALLLIQELFDRGYSQLRLEEMIELVHSHGMEVLLEAHSEDEFIRAVCSEADMVGINNRDLSTMSVDINTTIRILSKYGDYDKIVVSESGIDSPEHIRLLKKAGARAFLVGTAIMLADDVEKAVRSLVEAG